MIDLALISSFHMFILLLALNFQWSSRALNQEALDQESLEAGQTVKSVRLFQARNSIALHNLRLSDRDRAQLEVRKDLERARVSAKGNSYQIKNSVDLKNFFLNESVNQQKIVKSKSVANQKRIEDLSPLPKTVQKQGKSINELDFSFFTKVKKSIARRISREEVNMTNKSAFQKKNKRLQSLKDS